MHRGKMVDRISAEPPLANRVRAGCSPLLRGRRCKRSSSSNSRGVLLAFAAVLPSSAAMSCLSGGMLPISGHTPPLPQQLYTPAQRCRRRHRAARCIVKIDDDEAELCRIDEGCIYFVTGNMMKEREVNAILSEVDMPFRVTHVDIDLPELQGDALEIARHKCREAANKVDSAVLVEDTSLCFTALNGMPGPYIKWFQMVRAAASSRSRARARRPIGRSHALLCVLRAVADLGERRSLFPSRRTHGPQRVLPMHPRFLGGPGGRAGALRRPDAGSNRSAGLDGRLCMGRDLRTRGAHCTVLIDGSR
jgi:hypothetical protein